ncbi:MAG: hypothetical protein COB02_10685 [Candidatus Cloacimonadota bacterium]|nr:MAG: hypothetical protein COB02_10685 [Candidatus Cloacimonadota bacterium]
MKFKYFLIILFINIVCLNAQSLKDLSRYVKKNPSDLKSMYKLANGLRKAQKYKAAHKYWKRLLKQRPKDDKIRYFYAVNLFKLEEVSSALLACAKVKKPAIKKKCEKMIAKAEQDYPDDLYLYQAELAFLKKDYEKTYELLEELLSSEIDHPKYRLLLGKYYHATKDYLYAWDQYNFVLTTESNISIAKKLKSKLNEIGKKSLLYVLEHKSSIEDEADFYKRYSYALKLHSDETNRRVGGFKIKFETYITKQIDEDEESFENFYQLGFIQSKLKNKNEAKESFEKALNEAPDDFLYATVEFLIEDLDNNKDRQETIDDFISLAGGKEIYDAMVKAGDKAIERARDDEKSAINEVRSQTKNIFASLNMSEQEIVAEIDNFKRKLGNARNAKEKAQIKQQFQNKYGHIMKDPSMKSQMQQIMKSSAGKNLQKKYSKDLGSLKNKYGSKF